MDEAEYLEYVAGLDATRSQLLQAVDELIAY